MGREQVFTHGLLKTEIAAVLTIRVLGHYWCNGVLLTNLEAELSGNSDGVFVGHEALESGWIVFTEGAGEGYVELVGTPDMVLEVVSESSVAKDKVTLRQSYWEAGIPVYRIADARGERFDFHILKHGAKGYVETRKSSGWLKSPVFGRSFRLTRSRDRSGNPRFSLDVR